MSIHPDAHQHHARSIDELALLRLKKRMRLELELSERQEKAVAIDMRIDPAQLTRWLHDNYRDRFPADRLASWTLAVGPGLWNWLASDQPGEFTESTPQGPDLRTMVSRLANASGSSLAGLILDTEDNLWSLTECHERLPGLMKLEAIVIQLRKRAQAEVAP